MKEFEKWKNTNCIKHCNLVNIGVCGDCQGIGAKEDAWRAALEWIRSKSCCVRSIDLEKLNQEIVEELNS